MTLRSECLAGADREAHVTAGEIGWSSDDLTKVDAVYVIAVHDTAYDSAFRVVNNVSHLGCSNPAQYNKGNPNLSSLPLA